jgi:hypothetical protein
LHIFRSFKIGKDLFPTGCNFVNQHNFSFPPLQRGPTFLNNLSTTRIWQAISSPDTQRDAARDPLPGERRPHRPQRRGACRCTDEEAGRAARHGAPRRSMMRCPPGERACGAPAESCATASRLRGATGQGPVQRQLHGQDVCSGGSMAAGPLGEVAPPPPPPPPPPFHLPSPPYD